MHKRTNVSSENEDLRSEWTMTCGHKCDVLTPKCKDVPLGILCFWAGMDIRIWE